MSKFMTALMVALFVLVCVQTYRLDKALAKESLWTELESMVGTDINRESLAKARYMLEEAQDGFGESRFDLVVDEAVNDAVSGMLNGQEDLSDDESDDEREKGRIVAGKATATTNATAADKAENRRKRAAKRAELGKDGKNGKGKGLARGASAKLLASARKLIQSGAYDEAAARLQESIDSDPTHSRAYKQLADLYRRLGYTDEEMQVYADWAAAKPEDALPHFAMANALLRVGDDASVLAELGQFQDLVGDDISSYPMAASIYRRLGLRGEEGGVLEAWATSVPDSADAQRALGQYYRRIGDHEAALSQFQAVADITPRNVSAHADLASAYQRLGLFENAQNELLAAIQLRPNSPDLQYQLGESYRLGGDLYSAVDAYQSVIDLEPGSAEARRATRAMNRIQRQLNKSLAYA